MWGGGKKFRKTRWTRATDGEWGLTENNELKGVKGKGKKKATTKKKRSYQI